MIATKFQEFIGHVDCIYTAAVQNNDQKLFTAGGDGIVAAWDIPQGGDGVLLVRVKASVYSMCLFGNKLLLGSSTGNFYVVDLDSKTEERNIEAHQQGIFDIVHDKENSRIYTCGFDGIFNVWTEDFKLVQTIKLSGKSLRNICLLPDAIAVASSDFAIYILNRENFAIERKLEHHTNSVFALAYNPLTRELLSGGRDCYLKVWDTRTWRLTKEFVAATLHINHIAFNDDRSLYAVSSMDKILKIFDAGTHEPVKFISKEKDNAHTSSINKAMWLNSDTLISISDDKKAMGWIIK